MNLVYSDGQRALAFSRDDVHLGDTDSCNWRVRMGLSGEAGGKRSLRRFCIRVDI